MDADVKGDAYEGLLEKNAADVKGGAGQYFTPRALIRAIVDVHEARARPRRSCDPAGRHRRLPPRRPRLHRRTPPARPRPVERTSSDGALHGIEIVDATARLCAMNLYLHGIGR